MPIVNKPRAFSDTEKAELKLLLDAENFVAANQYVMNYTISTLKFYRRGLFRFICNYHQENNLSNNIMTSLLMPLIVECSDLTRVLDGAPFLFLTIFNVYFDEWSQANNLREVILSCYRYHREKLLNVINGASTNQINDFLYQSLFDICMINKDPIFIRLLKKIFPKAHHKKTLTSYGNELREILECPSPKYCSLVMNNFSDGFGMITSMGGVVVLSKIKDKKNYPFTPVHIASKNQWVHFLKSIQENITKLEGRQINFIQSGTHWICGSIFIKSQADINLLIIDCSGIDKSTNMVDDHEMLVIFKLYFEQSQIFFSLLTRQYTTVGCSVFALDDIRHLYTIDRYLPKESSARFPLLNYIERNAQTPIDLLSEEGSIVQVRPCNLPLIFNRTLQSRDLLSREEKSKNKVSLRYSSIIRSPSFEVNEEEWPTNKNTINLFNSSRKDFNFNSQKKILINTRLERKFNKMGQEVWQYLNAHTDEEIEATIREFSVDHFIESTMKLHAQTVVPQYSSDITR